MDILFHMQQQFCKVPKISFDRRKGNQSTEVSLKDQVDNLLKDFQNTKGYYYYYCYYHYLFTDSTLTR